MLEPDRLSSVGLGGNGPARTSYVAQRGRDEPQYNERSMAEISALQARVAQQILRHALANSFPASGHITELWAQNLCGTSRAPVRGALKHLNQLGVMRFDKNRGYTLLKDDAALQDALQSLNSVDNEAVYQKIAQERMAGELPDVISETELMSRFGLTRSRLRRVLDRIAQEGWIERRAGNGWLFLPLIDSARAYAESFEIREALEPAGLRSEFFQPEPMVLHRLLERQLAILKGHKNTSEVFEANAELHEQLARMSNNRFLIQIIAHHNHLRRLIEYKVSVDTERATRMCREHIEFLNLLIDGKVERAATSLAFHLHDARQAKLALLAST